MSRPLIVEPLLLWWIATFNRRDGPIGAGDTAEEAKANLIAQIAHAEPRDLRDALGELATPGEILGAINQIHGMIRELERDAEIARISVNYPARSRHLRAADRWTRAVNNLGRVAGVLS